MRKLLLNAMLLGILGCFAVGANAQNRGGNNQNVNQAKVEAPEKVEPLKESDYDAWAQQNLVQMTEAEKSALIKWRNVGFEAGYVCEPNVAAQKLANPGNLTIINFTDMLKMPADERNEIMNNKFNYFIINQ